MGITRFVIYQAIAAVVNVTVAVSIDVMIKRLYELEHDKNQKDKSKHEFLGNVNPYHNPSDTFIHCKKYLRVFTELY